MGSDSGEFEAVGGDGFGGALSAKFPSPVETLPQVRSTLPPAPGAGQVEKEDSDSEIGAHSFACRECGFSAKSAHGFARHVHTHGFGAVGRHLGK